MGVAIMELKVKVSLKKRNQGDMVDRRIIGET